ncbi:MAG: hypothetical protein M3P26_00240 [Gemmatimonadota bacterium]|nr:hypothetical protein [Gemmatimonadota bacterium]
MFRFRRAIGVITLTTTLACYTSLPVESFPPAVGNDLVAMLTDTGSAEMASVVGPKVTGLSGRYMGLAGDTLLLSVKTVIKRDGNEEFWRGERVGVRRSNVATLNRRQFSPVRSSAIVGGVVAALVAITSLVYSGHAGSGSKKPPPTQ